MIRLIDLIESIEWTGLIDFQVLTVRCSENPRIAGWLPWYLLLQSLLTLYPLSSISPSVWQWNPCLRPVHSFTMFR